MSTCSASPQRRQPPGSSASESVSHGTNGSQIRSTSAFDIRLRSATTIGQRGRAGEHRDGPRRARCARRAATARPAPSSGPPETRSAPRLPHTQYDERSGRRRCRPSSGRPARDRPPTTRSPARRSRAPRRAQRPRRPAAATTSAPARARRAPGRPAAAGRRSSSRTSRAAARRRRPSRPAPAGRTTSPTPRAPPGPSAASAAKTASAETARNTAAGDSTRNGAASRAGPSAPSSRSVTIVASGIDGRDRHDDQRRHEVAAEPEPHQRDVEEHRARRVPGEVDRPVVRATSTGCGRRTRRSIAGTSVISRADTMYSAGPPSPASARPRRRPARARPATPARRRTTPAAGGATTASGPRLAAPHRRRSASRTASTEVGEDARRRRSRAAAAVRACRCGRRRPSRAAAARRTRAQHDQRDRQTDDRATRRCGSAGRVGHGGQPRDDVPRKPAAGSTCHRFVRVRSMVGERRGLTSVEDVPTL